jgi:hypothetical protein
VVVDVVAQNATMPLEPVTSTFGSSTTIESTSVAPKRSVPAVKPAAHVPAVMHDVPVVVFGFCVGKMPKYVPGVDETW